MNRVSVRRTVIAACVVFFAGFALAYALTDGFRAYTLESARRLQALHSPLPLPDLALDLADGGNARLKGLPGQVLLVDFVYTRCPTMCSMLGSVYAQLQQRLAAEIASGDVRLVSVSFDPERDGVHELLAYRTRYSPNPAGWYLGRPASAEELRRSLAAFGVVVIPDGFGGFTHNAAVHVVGPERKLMAILDLGDIEGIVNTTREVSGRSARHVALH